MIRKLTLTLTHGCVLVYLAITAAAYIYTISGYKVPLLPWPLVRFSYGMMAPFQGYVTFEQGLLAEGSNDNQHWEKINHQKYFPYLRGERVLREWLLPFREPDKKALLKKKYGDLAAQIQAAEAREGRNYLRIRLHWERWPVSPLGHEVLHKDPYITREFLTEFPQT